MAAIAQEVGVEFPFSLFDEISRRVPFLAAVTPNNKFYT